MKNIYEIIKPFVAFPIMNSIKKKNLTLSLPQACWLVWQSEKTFESKKIAWKELVDLLPDTSFRKHNSFSVALRQYVDHQEELIKKFMEDDIDAVYSYVEEFESGGIHENKKLFANYKDAFFDVASDRDLDISQIIFTKRWKGNQQYMELLTNRNRNVLSVWQYVDDEAEDLFYNMWWAFPVSFKAGDVLLYKNQPFVFETICTDDSKRKLCQEERGDFTDMWCGGYFLNEDGTIYYDEIPNYVALDYAYGKDVPSTLKVVSQFMKGEMAIDTLLNAYVVNVNKNRAKELNASLNILSEERKFLGLE